jgi:peptide/nickel transport system ATP-binding protein
MIFQEPMTSLNPVFTCGQQVMEAIQQHQGISKSKAKEKTIDLFAKVRLPDPVNILKIPPSTQWGPKTKSHDCHGHELRTLLLIADEPTTALDVTVQKAILELIKEWQVQNKMAVLLITHDLGMVAEIADRIAVMYKGEIVEQGKAKTILQHPQHAYTKALLACRPTANKKGKRLPVVADFLDTQEIPSHKEIPGNPSMIKSDIALKVDGLKVYYPLPKNYFHQNKIISRQ